MSGSGKLYRESSCDGLRSLHSARLHGGARSAEERLELEQHLSSCAICSEQTPSVRQLRQSLKSMPAPVPPADLSMRLRVAASQEGSRRQRRSALGLWKIWQADLHLSIQNLFRPLVIPTAGGFVSAVVLFAVLAASPSMRVVSADTGFDVPTALYREASVYSYLPLDFDEQDVVVELTVDQRGQMLDYELPDHEYAPPALRRSIEKHLLTMQFNPARSFGKATHGRVRIWFRTSRIDVKG